MARQSMPKGAPGRSMKPDFKSLKRAIKKFFEYFPALAPTIVGCILFASLVASIPSIFSQKILQVIETHVESQNWTNAWAEMKPLILILVALYVLALIAQILQSQLMAFVTQSYLDKFRKEMFGGMQKLPIRFFDTNKHGDIMSYYTNDIDTLRQLISQTFPQLIQSGAVVICVLAVMLYFSVWLTLVLLLGVVAMFVVTKYVGGGSAKFFIRQQMAVAETEGFIQEMMNGQKVVKVFNHEQKAIDEFVRINNNWGEVSTKAHAYSNILGPVIQNIGNILYVILALVGGVLIALHVPNVSLSGKILDITILVPFLNMAKQFTGNVNTLSQQVNFVVMASAGASRIFALIDEKPEADEGYVTLVNVNIKPDGSLEETSDRTNHWAWKHPHKADGTVTYQLLEGNVEMHDVDFAYVEGKQVLSDITLYAKPGQKVAFVGATGAGKTTITNLINRYYDIADGKIRYDGININKIVKADLRKSLGIVLQETNLFTGTVMDNIRYGLLEATDDECIAAAKLAGADDFITRLPDGYNTMLSNNGSNLSQGQRQLIAIARAAVANPPVMILDEATSSIDTRTEAIVQKGMDKLMEGRTVFVIAHRLSTVMNSDVIMVLDHGAIIERGTHKELIDQQGVYYQLYTGAFELE